MYMQGAIHTVQAHVSVLEESLHQKEMDNKALATDVARLRRRLAAALRPASNSVGGGDAGSASQNTSQCSTPTAAGGKPAPFAVAAEGEEGAAASTPQAVLKAPSLETAASPGR